MIKTYQITQTLCKLHIYQVSHKENENQMFFIITQKLVTRVEILELQGKSLTSMVSCSRFIMDLKFH